MTLARSLFTAQNRGRTSHHPQDSLEERIGFLLKVHPRQHGINLWCGMRRRRGEVQWDVPFFPPPESCACSPGRSLASSTESSSVMAFTFSSIDFISPRTEAAARTDEEEGRGGGGEAMSGACAGVTDARFNRCLLNH